MLATRRMWQFMRWMRVVSWLLGREEARGEMLAMARTKWRETGRVNERLRGARGLFWCLFQQAAARIRKGRVVAEQVAEQAARVGDVEAPVVPAERGVRVGKAEPAQVGPEGLAAKAAELRAVPAERAPAVPQVAALAAESRTREPIILVRPTISRARSFHHSRHRRR